MGEMGLLIDRLDSLSRPLLEALLNSFWQGMIIAAMVWLLLRSIRRVSATTRHAVWLVSLLTIGALPLIAIFSMSSVTHSGSMNQPLRREQMAPAGEAGEPVLSPESDTLLVEATIARLDSPVRTLRSDVNSDLNRTMRIEETSKVVTLDESTKVVPKTAAGTVQWNVSRKLEANPSPQGRHPWGEYFFSRPVPLLLICIWLMVGLVMLGRILCSYVSIFRLRRRLGFVPSEQRERVQHLAEIFGIRRTVRIYTSHQISVPMTIGSFRPIIVLHCDLIRSLSSAEFESVIAHELAHIKRWDYLINLLQRLVQAVFFFHPAVWFIGKQMVIERELACDDWAVKTCEPRRYASCLTKLVELLSESKTFVAAAGILFGKNVISRRVEMILNRDHNATTAVSKLALVYTIGLAVTLVSLCSLISPVIAVPLAQDRAERPQSKEESRVATAAQTASQEMLAVPATPASPIADPLLPRLPGGPVRAVAPLLPSLPAIAAVDLELDLFPPSPAPVVSAVPAMLRQGNSGLGFGVGYGVGTGQGFGADYGIGQSQGFELLQVAPLAQEAIIRRTPVAPVPAPAPQPRAVVIAPWDQDDKDKTPVIPEAELLGVLTEIVKRDADPAVRNEALQGIYRMRSDAAINTLLELYDGASDVKVKGEIIGYLLRRNGDNTKAIAKLMTIARSDSSDELRTKAIRSLANVKGDEGANNLIQIYDGLQDSKMKQTVIRYFGVNKSRKAIDKLILIAKNDTDPLVRQAAIRTLYGIDERHYFELVDKTKAKISALDPNFKFDFNQDFKFEFDKVYEFDTKKWLEAQKEFQQKIQESQEKYRELLEKLRIEDLNKLWIEMPKIELRLRDLENEINLGREIELRGQIERQLRLQLVQVGNQIAALRSQLGESHPKVLQTRSLLDTLEKHYGKVRKVRPREAQPATTIRTTTTLTPRAVVIPSYSVAASRAQGSN